jgi:hypothetical protein
MTVDNGQDRISLPFGFDVPDGWTPVDPEKVGAPSAAFVAVRPDSGGDFTPNITLSVRHRPDAATILEIADEAVERLGRSMAELDVLSRREVGAPPDNGVAQVLRIVSGSGQELVQSQVHLTVPGTAGRRDRVIVELACTSAPQQSEPVVGEFQRFVASFHVRSGGTLSFVDTQGDTQ